LPPPGSVDKTTGLEEGERKKNEGNNVFLIVFLPKPNLAF
jgi:hypothetical protein